MPAWHRGPICILISNPPPSLKQKFHLASKLGTQVLPGQSIIAHCIGHLLVRMSCIFDHHDDHHHYHHHHRAVARPIVLLLHEFKGVVEDAPILPPGHRWSWRTWRNIILQMKTTWKYYYWWYLQRLYKSQRESLQSQMVQRQLLAPSLDASQLLSALRGALKKIMLLKIVSHQMLKILLFNIYWRMKNEGALTIVRHQMVKNIFEFLMLRCDGH